MRRRILIPFILLLLAACTPATQEATLEAVEMYRAFIESGQWQSFYVSSAIQDGANVNLESFSVISYQFYYLDGGVPALWFRAGDNAQQVDFFCTIEGGNVAPLISAHNANAQIGGSWIEILHDTELETYVVAKRGFSRWGGSAYWSTLHEYSEGKLTEVARLMRIIENGEATYSINDVQVSPETFYGRLISPIFY